MGVSGKTIKITSVIAALCIAIYIAAVSFGAVRIFLNISERRNLAENEFYDLADRASSSAVFLGFMSEAYQQTLKDSLANSETLLALIVTGASGEYAFERQPGSGIVWAGNSPRFRTGPAYPGEPFFLPLRIDGQRNVTIQAIYERINYGFFQRILRDTLLAVLLALVIAFLTLLAEMFLKKKPALSDSLSDRSSGSLASGGSKASDRRVASAGNVTPGESVDFSEDIAFDENAAFMESEISDEIVSGRNTVSGKSTVSDRRPVSKPKARPVAPKEDEEDETPQGLYTTRGNIGWESYTQDRLASELHRCASFEQDLVFLAAEFKETGNMSDSLYGQFAEEAVSFFTMRDMIFEKGEKGISVIMPNADLDRGITKSEEFRQRIIERMPASFKNRTQLCIGLSSRSGRLIDSERIIFEAFSALLKALEDPVSHVIAFKSDPEKYREFIKGHPS